MFLLGAVLQFAFIRPLRTDEREELSLLVTWAIALGIEGVLSVLYKTNYRSTIPSYADRSWSIDGYRVSEVRVFAFAISMFILGLLFVLLTRTRFGRAVRATVQNPVSARCWASTIGASPRWGSVSACPPRRPRGRCTG